MSCAYVMRLGMTRRGAFSTRYAYRTAHVALRMSQDGKSAIALLPTARENHWSFLVTQEIASPDFDVVGRF